jgi:hypothetical protein
MRIELMTGGLGCASVNVVNEGVSFKYGIEHGGFPGKRGS